MAVSGTEPVSVQDLGISLNGTAAADGIGSQPASVEDLQLVVQGMQEKADEQLAEVAGATYAARLRTNNMSNYSAYDGASTSSGWGGSSNAVPATGRYRITLTMFGSASYTSDTYAVFINDVNSGSFNSPTGYTVRYLMKEFDLNKGQAVNIRCSGDGSPGNVVISIQRIK